MTTKIYVLIYDYDHGNREDCNIFYSPIEVFADAATREKRIDLLCKTNPDIGYRTEDLEPMTIHDFDIPDQYLPDPDDEVADTDADDSASEDDTDDATQPVAAHMPPEEEAGDGFIYGNRSWLSVDPEEYLFYATYKRLPVLGKNVVASYIVPVRYPDLGKQVTAVYIVPVRYWNEHKQRCTEECRIDLPFEFENLGDNIFMYEGTPSAARGKLRELGIQEDPEFNEHCANL